MRAIQAAERGGYEGAGVVMEDPSRRFSAGQRVLFFAGPGGVTEDGTCAEITLGALRREGGRGTTRTEVTPRKRTAAPAQGAAGSGSEAQAGRMKPPRRGRGRASGDRGADGCRCVHGS